MYLHERENWTDFQWDAGKLAGLLEEVSRKQGLLYGRLNGLGFDSKLTAMAENLTKEVIYSSEIEGITLNVEQVRSSIARRLGLETVKYTAPSHYVESVVAVMIDAVRNYAQPIDKGKLCAWQAAFFPVGFSEGLAIDTGRYRTHEEHIVSGTFGRERILYIAPSPSRVEDEMSKFINWFNTPDSTPSVVRSAIAHLWFVSIHPFEDGNGRLARILSEILLARGDNNELRFYNISSRINKDKKHYYDILERTQRGSGDVTEWIDWYLSTLSCALDDATASVSAVLNKSLFWQRVQGVAMNARQADMLNRFLDGYEAKITTKNWASLAKVSSDTANRDIQDLVAKSILRIEIPGVKRPSYAIVYDQSDLTQLFSDVSMTNDGDCTYITATYKGEKVRERLLKLDAERFSKGELSLSVLLEKYCSYLVRL